jgi:tetratricopeptide (TPR) repeat protein
MTGQFSAFGGAGWTSWSSAAAMEMAARDYRAADRASAAQRCHEIIARDAWHFEALHLLGVLCLEAAQFEAAITYLDRALRARPDSAVACFQLGNALMGQERYEEAIAAFCRVVGLAPSYIDAHNNMGNALAALQRHEAAIECFRQALAIRPGYPPALFNLGKQLVELDELEPATDCFRNALASAGPKAEPARVTDIYVELSRVLLALGRHEEALAVTRSMLALNSDPGWATWYASMVLLALGLFTEGWEKYEARYSVEGRKPPHAAARVLDLAEISRKRILVCAEQGFSDTIMFARYAGLLARAGAQVSLVVDRELQPLLLEMDGIATVIEPGEPEPSVDLVTALPSLPLAFRTELASIPAEVPYLRAPTARLATWQEQLGPWRQLRVGICWWGPPGIPGQSMPLASLAPVLSRADLEFHLVQKEIPLSDREWLSARPAIRDHSDALDDFADTAALMSLLDLIITIDTSVAHLAGALARPVWIMLPSSADWCWLLDRDDSPWYPTARLFRQPRRGDWDSVAAAVSQAIEEYPVPEDRSWRADRVMTAVPTTLAHHSLGGRDDPMTNANQTAAPALSMFHSNIVPLNAELHATLKLNRSVGFGYSAGAATVPIGLGEFEAAARSYPILFTDASPPIPVVLLGVRAGWNMFVNETGSWMPGAYIPALVTAFPFAIIEDAAGGTRQFGFEVDAACVSPTTGLALFEDGKPTSAVSEAFAFCDACQTSLNESIVFGAALDRAQLLMPQTATIEIKGGGTVTIDGFRTVDRNRLAAVHDEVLLAWRLRNWLLPLYAHVFSAANWVPFTELATSQLAARQ